MPKKYQKQHTTAIKELEQYIPGAINAIEMAKADIDKSLRAARRRKAYLSGAIWLPKSTMRIKDLENVAAYYEDGHLQSNIESVLAMAELADKWSKGGYITYDQIKFMSGKLGIDENEMINYNLFQMKDAIHQAFSTGLTAEEKEEFGYIDLEAR